MRSTLAALALAFAGAGPALACKLPAFEPPARTLSDDNGFELSWRFAPEQPKVGEFFAIEFAACFRAAAVSVETLRVDATMPAHRHGMNFQPKIAMAGPGLYRAEGLMFHMPGTWRLVFEQRGLSHNARVTTDIEIE